MSRKYVKCPECGYVFRTASNETAQCSVSNGCGFRFPIKENEVIV